MQEKGWAVQGGRCENLTSICVMECHRRTDAGITKLNACEMVRNVAIQVYDLGNLNADGFGLGWYDQVEFAIQLVSRH